MRLTPWLAIVGLLSAAGASAGWGLGQLLKILSADYVVVPSDYTSLGLRLGLLVGNIVGACGVIGDWPPATRRDLGLALAVVSATILVMVVGACTLLRSALLRAEFAQHILNVDTGALAHPRRFLLFMAIHYAAAFGAVLGALLAGALLLHRRGTVTWRSTN